MKKATLYTSASLNGSWLLTSIDIALWLNKSEGFKEITICTCDSGHSSYNFFSLLLRFKNLFTLYTANNIKKIFARSQKTLIIKKKKTFQISKFCYREIRQNISNY